MVLAWSSVDGAADIRVCLRTRFGGVLTWSLESGSEDICDIFAGVSCLDLLPGWDSFALVPGGIVIGQLFSLSGKSTGWSLS